MKYKDLTNKQKAAYENAVDDLYFGYGFNFWYEGRGGSIAHKEYFANIDEAKKIWRMAFNYVTKDI